MGYRIHIEATIEEDGEHFASLNRHYDVDALANLGDCIAHFNQAASSLLEGAAADAVAGERLDTAA